MCIRDRNQRLSTTATDAPRLRALYAAASPAGPAPMTTKSNEGIRSVSRSAGDRGRVAALPPGLVRRGGGGDGDVGAVGDPERRQSDVGDVAAPSVAQAM